MSEQVKSELALGAFRVVDLEDAVFFISEDFFVFVVPDPEVECDYAWNAWGFGVEDPGEDDVAHLWSLYQMVSSDADLPS